MTLNFTSYYSTFPSSISSNDDYEYSSPNRNHVENSHFGNSSSSASSYWCNWDAGNGDCSNYESGGVGRDYAYDDDPVDRLPADPFGMDSSTLSAAIAGWIEDFGNKPFNAYDLYYWPQSKSSNTSSVVFDDWVDVGYSDIGGSFVNVEEEVEDLSVGVEEEDEGDVAHEGLMYCLGYLGVEDLLSVERVSKSLRVAVKNDSLLWRCIHIDSPPLSERVTDDAILRLTERAQGNLQCLSLMGCSRITDDGIRRVLESNLKLQKLSVSGCVRLSIDGLISNLKAFKASGMTGIKHLKLGRLFNVLPEHYEELHMLLSGYELRDPKTCKPRYYHLRVSSVACDDERAIDIELCPRCEKFKLVFDCPSESCRDKGPEHCRACDVCIGRCVQCGRCINDCRYVETFFLDYLCSSCQEELEE